MNPGRFFFCVQSPRSPTDPAAPVTSPTARTPR
jgi:hypothetical protein